MKKVLLPRCLASVERRLYVSMLLFRDENNIENTTATPYVILFSELSLKAIEDPMRTVIEK